MKMAPRGSILLALLLVISTTACRVVRAHERGNLSKRGLAGDQDRGEARFNGHWTGAREGADGGTGQPGGGCGCN